MWEGSDSDPLTSPSDKRSGAGGQIPRYQRSAENWLLMIDDCDCDCGVFDERMRSWSAPAMTNYLLRWNVSNTMNLRQDDGGESEGRSPNIKALLVIGFIVIGRAGGYPLQTKSKHLFLMVWPSIIGTIIIPGHVSQEKSLQRDLVPSNGGKNWWSLLVYF